MQITFNVKDPRNDTHILTAPQLMQQINMKRGEGVPILHKGPQRPVGKVAIW